MMQNEAPFWHLIVNPAAGGGTVGRRWPHIEQLLQALGFSYAVHFSTHRGHAAQLAENAILRGGRYLMGLGGDGTNHEIVNGIMGQRHVPPESLHYALLPIGTGNDWAREYGLPNDPRLRLRQLQQLGSRLQDVGHIAYRGMDGSAQQRYFVNVAGLAYDGFIGQKMTEHPVRNRLQYLLMVARYLLAYTPSEATIRFDDQMVVDQFYTINVGLCRFSGGGMQLTPHARPDDGLFALTYALKIPKWEVMLQTGRFYRGTILEHPKVRGFQTASIRVEPRGAAPVLLEADGEFLGQAPAVFSLLPRALRVG